MEKFWNFLNGRKSIITACLILVVNSDWIAGMFSSPELYILVQGLAGLLFGGSIIHHEVKRAIDK